MVNYEKAFWQVVPRKVVLMTEESLQAFTRNIAAAHLDPTPDEMIFNIVKCMNYREEAYGEVLNYIHDLTNDRQDAKANRIALNVIQDLANYLITQLVALDCYDESGTITFYFDDVIGGGDIVLTQRPE